MRQPVSAGLTPRPEEAADAVGGRAVLFFVLPHQSCRDAGRWGEAEFVGKALAAWERRPHRAEPGLDIPCPAGDAPFIEGDVYDGGLAEDHAIAADHSTSAAQKDRGRRI